MIEDECEYEDYLPLKEIDFGRIYQLFHSLVLFDDVYLNMQGMNVALVDPLITQHEHSLLRRYIEIERTPTDECMLVSALSQMWIFALYELLRTWRGRILQLKKLDENGGLAEFIRRKEIDEMNMSAHYRASQARRMNENAEFKDQMLGQLELMAPVINMVDSIRVNLAKHEIPGRKNYTPRMPGYGRIDMRCGAMNFEIITKHEEFLYINRRDIADALRTIEI